MTSMGANEIGISQSNVPVLSGGNQPLPVSNRDRTARLHDSGVAFPLQPDVSGKLGSGRPKGDDVRNAHATLLQIVAGRVNTHRSSIFATDCAMSTRGERLRQARREAGFSSASEAARALGVAVSTYNAHERAETPGARDFGTDDASVYGRRFGVSASWLLLGKEPKTPPAGEGFRAAPELVTDNDPLPVYAAAEGGDGNIIVSVEEIERSPRPYMLQGVGDAYGILVTGDSMIPAFRPGDVAWVNPRLPPMRGAEAIFYTVNDVSGEARASIKELVSWTEKAWTVQQWNPAKTFQLPRPHWNRCHRVVGRLIRR